MYRKNIFPLLFLAILVTLVSSCKKDALPKPQAYLALEYPQQVYKSYHDSTLGFSFEKNDMAQVSKKDNHSLELYYPQMKATIFMNYKAVDNNLDILLSDAQKLTYEHFIKADQILEHPYINPQTNTSGMLYDVQGNAATNVQFYATDSTKNFLVASLYFYTIPNFDSILPAKQYLHKDMITILETLEWKK